MSDALPIYTDIKRRLNEVISRYYNERILLGSLVSISLWMVISCLFSLLEAFFNFGATGRSIIFITGSLLILCSASWYFGRPVLQKFKVLKGISHEEIALKVGQRFPAIKDRLRNILDIFELRDDQVGYSPELVEASFYDLQRAMAGMRLADVISFVLVRKVLRYTFGIAIMAAIMFGFSAIGAGSALYRIVHFQSDFQPPAPFEFIVHPGNMEIVKGESVPITISMRPVTGSFSVMPREINLVVKPEDVSLPEKFRLRADTGNIFSYSLASIRQSVLYFAEADKVQSERFTITVSDRPFVRSLRLHLTFPSYSGLPAHYLDDNIGDVGALPGTILRWEIVPSKEIRNGLLLFASGKKLALGDNGKTFFASMVLHGPALYHIELHDKEGIPNVNPIYYKIEVMPDEPPRVSLIFPGKNVDVTEVMQLPLEVKLHDDFGFSSLRIAYRLAQSRYEKPQEQFSIIPIPLDEGRSTDATVNFLWNLSPLGLVPEDVVEYRVEVFDNDNISGPKMGVSESFLIRLPSLEEVFVDAEKSQDEAIKHLDETLQDAEALKKDLNEISEEMKKNQPLDWQKQKKIEEIAQRYQELQKKVDDVSKNIDAMTQELQKNNVLSTETLQKYMELQQLFQQINSPEFQQTMKRMQEAMQNISPEQLRQAMQQAQFSEEAFRKSIERTMSLLKRIQIEQKVDELVKQASDLQQKQDQLQKETAGLSPGDNQKADRLAQKQDDIDKQLQGVQKDLAELRKKMEDFPHEMPLEHMQRSEDAAGNQEMQEAMRHSSQQLRAHQGEHALELQLKASKGVQQMSQSFSELQQQLLANQMAEALNGLRKAMMDLLELSQRQEELKNQSGSLDANSARFRENAQEQLNLQSDASNIVNGLADLSQKTFAVTPEMGKALGQAMGHMNQALSGLEQRNGSFASKEQGESMASLNKAATLVQESMQSMQQGGAGSGMGSLFQQLQMLSGQQQGINMQSQSLLGGGQGEGLSQEQMQEIGRLAAQQDVVRKSLEQLNKEAQGSPDRSRILGDLQSIADEMREVVKNMQQGNINPTTIQKQERILSRLLDAQSSLRERDYEQRRKATAGVTPVRKSPAELGNESLLNQLRKDILKSIESGYTKDYQELIRRYYEAVGKLKITNYELRITN